MRPTLAVLALASLLAIASPLFGRQPVRARHAMVVAEESLAAAAGVSVLKSGGNAVDAAVAVGFALAVTHPYAGNLGGGGFVLYRSGDGRVSFLDFRERAPRKAFRDMYIGADGRPTRASVEGWRAAGVPGTVRGLEMMHRKWGRKSWSALLQPAVAFARDGFVLSHREARAINESKRLPLFEESRRVFLSNGRPWQQGDRFLQPDLARTLDRIAARGADEFYTGDTARVLAREMERHGGLITLADLRDYRPVERAPLQGCYRGHEIYIAPPPSSGGVATLQMLGMLERSEYEKPGQGAAATIHYVAETMRRAYADRAEHLGDPGHHRVPLRTLLDAEYLRGRRDSIDRERATPSRRVHPAALRPEPSETTHYSIVDRDGNAVSLTYTLNGGFGSGVTVPGLGFLLNNEMDDFAAKPGSPNMFGLVQGEANAIAPGKRPLSSMTPAIVTRSGKLFLVLGGPGGPRIITSVLQTILNVIDFGLNVQDAVDRPRFHHQWLPDKLYLEPGFSPDTVRLLERRGHDVEITEPQSLIEAILVADDGWLEGAADGRAAATAQGY